MMSSAAPVAPMAKMSWLIVKCNWCVSDRLLVSCHHIPLVSCVCRKLTRRQRSLMLSYAEEETDVEGTVNGVSASAGQITLPEIHHDLCPSTGSFMLDVKYGYGYGYG